MARWTGGTAARFRPRPRRMGPTSFRRPSASWHQSTHPAFRELVANLADELPHFRAHSSDITVVTEPQQFYQEVLVRTSCRPWDPRAQRARAERSRKGKAAALLCELVRWQGGERTSASDHAMHTCPTLSHALGRSVPYGPQKESESPSRPARRLLALHPRTPPLAMLGLAPVEPAGFVPVAGQRPALPHRGASRLAKATHPPALRRGMGTPAHEDLRLR